MAGHHLRLRTRGSYLIITGCDLAIGDWVAKQLGSQLEDYWPFTAIGFSIRDELVAGVIYNNFHRSDRDIQLTAAATNPRWMTKNNLQSIFEYPYNQLSCVRTTAVTGRKNKRTRKLLVGLGYRQEGCCRKAMGGTQDAIIYGMLEKECRWIPK